MFYRYHPYEPKWGPIGYQSTFLVISGIVCVATAYAFIILKKDNEQVDGQPLLEQ